MYRPAPLLALLLCACAAPTYQPYTVEVIDPIIFRSDLSLCQGYAKAYPQAFSPTAVVAAGVAGGLQNAPGAAVSPLVPVVGALGSAAEAVLSGIDVLNSNQRKIVIMCMTQKGIRSGAFLVLDPN